MKFDAILLNEYKVRVQKQSEIERFNRAKLKLQDKAIRLADEIVKTQGEVIELQQQGITHLDQQKQELQVEVKGLKDNTSFLLNRYRDLQTETLDEVEKQELKETIKELSFAEANATPITSIDEVSNEPILDTSEPYDFVIGTDENGKKSYTRKKLI